MPPRKQASVLVDLRRIEKRQNRNRRLRWGYVSRLRLNAKQNEHHRFLPEQWLAHWDELTARIVKFDPAY
jgi:hypothetical protein